MMSQAEKYYDNLKEAVEKIAGRKLYSHSDFTELSESIYQKTKTIISPTTLKRFWGYLKNESPNPQVRSLNVLAVFAGHIFQETTERRKQTGPKAQNGYVQGV